RDSRSLTPFPSNPSPCGSGAGVRALQQRAPEFGRRQFFSNVSEPHARQPLGMGAGVGSSNHIEILLLQPLRNGADRTVADLAVINFADRRDLGGRSGEENLVGEVELVA